MTKFYSIRHNNAYKRGMPEIREIVRGIVDRGPCPTCGKRRRSPQGDLQVHLGKTRARTWPDLLACGDYPCFVISDRFVAAMHDCGLQLRIGGRVEFVGRNETGLSLIDAPKYFWIDGTKSQAGKMDFDASGYVDVRFCPDCGVRSDDISRTYDRQHADPPPGQVFEYDESSGLDLFTTDLAPTAFFCTSRVYDCVRRHKLINVALRPTEQGIVGEPLRIQAPNLASRPVKHISIVSTHGSTRTAPG